MSNIRTGAGRLVASAVGVAALLGLAACGTDTSTAAPGSAAADAGTAGTDAAAPGGPSDSAMAAYTSCLEENGVTMPEPPAGGQDGGQGGGQGGGRGGPPPDGGTPPSGAPAAPGGGAGGPGREPGAAPEGVDEATWEAARSACADLAPTPPGGAPSGTATDGT